MKPEEVKIDLEELKEFKKQNALERLVFIDFMVKYIKEHSDEEWSKQQAVVIDSQVES